MSMRPWPASWNSAEYGFIWMRIWRICDFGGRRPPVKPLMRSTASGPAIRRSASSSSSGSSGRDAISADVSTLPKPCPAEARSSGRTLHVLGAARQRELQLELVRAGAQGHVLLARLEAESWARALARPNGSPLEHDEAAASVAPSRTSSPASTETTAPGMAAPLGSSTSTRRLGCAAAAAGGVRRSRASLLLEVIRLQRRIERPLLDAPLLGGAALDLLLHAVGQQQAADRLPLGHEQPRVDQRRRGGRRRNGRARSLALAHLPHHLHARSLGLEREEKRAV
jgi:hypothetical protein